MPSPEVNNLIIVGGGPAGLSAAVNAASEGLQTVVVDGANQLGGQARTSTLIENYAGFPDGITGRDLTTAMVRQATKFRADIQAPLQVEDIDVDEDRMTICDDGLENIIGQAVLISSGVQYRRHPARFLAAYLGIGVSYGSPNISSTYKDKKLFVVGGANSAGQAALHLAKFPGCDVNLLVRGKTIEEKMSAYLAERITDAANIAIHTETEVVEVGGETELESITISRAGEEQKLKADRLFLLIGAIPKTKWLPDKVAKDELGFVLAGSDIPEEIRGQFAEEYGRQPLAHETCIRGLFVAGDVRSGSVKRVSGAAGDGASVISELHQYLSDLRKT